VALIIYRIFIRVVRITFNPSQMAPSMGKSKASVQNSRWKLAEVYIPSFGRMVAKPESEITNLKRRSGNLPRACQSEFQVQQEATMPSRPAEVKAQTFTDVAIWRAQLEFCCYASAPRIPEIAQKSGFARWQSIGFGPLLINRWEGLCSPNFRKS
jgi:hypothetical protein